MYRQLWACLAIALVCMVGTGPCLADDVPLPEQVIQRTLAAQAKYKSINTTYKVKQFVDRADGNGRVHLSTSSVLWLTQGTRSYYKRVQQDLAPVTGDVVAVSQVQFAIDAKEARKLELPNNAATPQATVLRNTAAAQSLDMGPDAAMWNACGRAIWSEAKNTNATVKRDPVSGLLTLTSHHAGPAMATVVTVDPDRGYLPVKTELRSADGTAIITVEVTELKQTKDGLWFPKAYRSVTHTTEPADYVNEYIVESADVNTAIPAGSLGIIFPAGTVVRNQITGKKYIATAD